MPTKARASRKRQQQEAQEEEPVMAALTPEAVDRIIDQNVEGPVVIPEEEPNLIDKVKAWFKRKE